MHTLAELNKRDADDMSEDDEDVDVRMQEPQVTTLITELRSPTKEPEEKKADEPRLPSPPPLSPAELRERRLAAMMGGLTTTTASAPDVGGPPSQKKQRKVETPPRSLPPVSKPSSATPTRNTTSKATLVPSVAPTRSHSAPSPPKKALEIPPERREAWIHLCVGYVLKLRYANNADASLTAMDARYRSMVPCFNTLPDVNLAIYTPVEYEAVFDLNAIDILLLDRFEEGFTSISSFKYLLQCYERQAQIAKRIKEFWDLSLPAEEQQSILAHIRRSILTFSGMRVSQVQDDENDYYKSRNEFMHLLMANNFGRQFPPKFLEDLCEAMDDEDEFNELMEIVWKKIVEHSQAFLSQARDNFANPMNALIRLSKVEKFGVFLLNNRLWNPSVIQVPSLFPGRPPSENGAGVRFLPLLSFMYYGVDHPEATAIFQGIGGEHADRRGKYQEFRAVLHQIQDLSCAYFSALVRIKNETVRKAVTNMFQEVMKANRTRTQTFVMPGINATDDFFLNLNWIMVALCGPIIKKNMFKKINVKYLAQHTGMVYDFSEVGPRLGYSEADYKEKIADDEKERDEPQRFGFVSEIFWLTMECLHLGYIPALNKIENLWMMVTRMPDRVNPGALLSPRDELEARFCEVQDPRLANAICGMYMFFCRYLLHLFESGNEADYQTLLEIPQRYIVDLSAFLAAYHQHGSVSSTEVGGRLDLIQKDVLIKVLLKFIDGRNPRNPIRSVHLRSNLLNVLASYAPPMNKPERPSAFLTYDNNHPFNSMEICRTSLIPCILQMYADLKSGAGVDLRDQFRGRHSCTQILRFLCKFPVHLECLYRTWTTDKPHFVNFMNNMLNDLNYFLEDGLLTVEKLKTRESEIARGESSVDVSVLEWRENSSRRPNGQPENKQQEVEDEIDEQRQHASTMFLYANETVPMLSFLANGPNVDHFLDSHILPRTTTLISVYLVKLAGNPSTLSVKNRDKLNFKPKFLLETIMRFCVRMFKEDQFIESLADDPRFDESSFREAVSIARRLDLIHERELAEFEQNIARVVRKQAEQRELEDRLGDIPDEYLDPLMYTLMKDPVTVPGKTQMVMDRSVIERHLLNNNNHPFTREPLAAEDLIPNPELKAEIDAWVQSKTASG